MELFAIIAAASYPVAVTVFCIIERWQTGYVSEDDARLFLAFGFIWPVVLLATILLLLTKSVHKMANFKWRSDAAHDEGNPK